MLNDSEQISGHHKSDELVMVSSSRNGKSKLNVNLPSLQGMAAFYMQFKSGAFGFW
jgi:hypothetical protein